MAHIRCWVTFVYVGRGSARGGQPIPPSQWGPTLWSTQCRDRNPLCGPRGAPLRSCPAATCCARSGGSPPGRPSTHPAPVERRHRRRVGRRPVALGDMHGRSARCPAWASDRYHCRADPRGGAAAAARAGQCGRQPIHPGRTAAVPAAARAGGGTARPHRPLVPGARSAAQAVAAGCVGAGLAPRAYRPRLVVAAGCGHPRLRFRSRRSLGGAHRLERRPHHLGRAVAHR